MTNWYDIPGWLADDEGEALCRLATDKNVLEIGSYLGRSTCCMLTTAKKVTAVDHHHGDAYTGPANTLEDFLANVAPCCETGQLQPIVKRVEDINWDDMAGAFDLVFIDAAHDVRSVEQHTRIALKVVRSGGVIAWHDWGWPTVQRGVRACGLEPTGFQFNLAWICVPDRPSL